MPKMLWRRQSCVSQLPKIATDAPRVEVQGDRSHMIDAGDDGVIGHQIRAEDDHAIRYIVAWIGDKRYCLISHSQSHV